MDQGMAIANSLPVLSVAETLDRFPQTARIFVRLRMACVGCDIAAFHTVAEAAAIYGLDAEQFFVELSLHTQESERAELSTPEEIT
jgi:hybrid cluster-associated redox disulfide protein